MAGDAVYSMLGLCAKAGKLICGQDQTEKAVRERKAFLVMISTDASEGTKKRMRDKCASYNVPLAEYGLKEELGRAVGKQERSCIAVTDKGLADTMIRKTGGINPAAYFIHGGGNEDGKG